MVIIMQTSNSKRLGSGYSSIYKTPEWKEEQYNFEIHLGNYARNHLKAHRAVDSALRKMKYVLSTHYEKFGAEVVQAFNTSLTPKNPYMLTSKMEALYNASGISSDASSQSISFKNIMQEIVTSNRNRSNYLIDKLGLNKRSVDEAIKHNSKNIFKAGLSSGLHNLFKGPDVYSKYGMDFKSYDKYDRGLKVKYNTDEKKEPAQNIQEKTNDTASLAIKGSISPNGFRLTENGSSSITTKLLNTAKWLGLKGQDLLNFRLAIMGWLLPDGNHSLYEILYSSHAAGIRGKEDLTDAASMDETIDPLTKDEIRDNCGADYVNKLLQREGESAGDFKGFNEKLLPIENVYYKRNDLELNDRMPDETKSELTQGTKTYFQVVDMSGPHRQAATTYKSPAHLLINHAIIFNKFRIIPRIQQHNSLYRDLVPIVHDILFRKIKSTFNLTRPLVKYLKNDIVLNPIVNNIYNGISALSDEYSNYIDETFNNLKDHINNIIPDFNKMPDGDKSNPQIIKLYRKINTLLKEYSNKIAQHIIKDAGLNVFGWRMNKLLDDAYVTANMLQDYLRSATKFSGHVYSGQRMLPSYYLGGTITTSMFTSTSKRKETAASYYKGAILVFNLHNTGVDIGDDLNQVLIPPGCKFKVKKVTTTPEKGDEVSVGGIKQVKYVYFEEAGNNYSNPSKVYPTKLY